MISIARPLLSSEEEAAIQRVLASGQLAQGENVAAFERRFAEVCHVREAVALSSGTAALHLALLAHDIGPGDEVITTAFTFAATANAILLAGATPVFVDIEPDTYTIDPALVESAITSRTKAIMPVHLYGHPCNMKRLGAIAATYGLTIIEDACQAHAAKIDGKPVGSFGTGCFSFYATKNITTGEGGMVTTDDPGIAERVRLLRNHGQTERYHHARLGYNLRMTEMQGALGLVQVEKLERFTEQRIANGAFLTERLRGPVQTPIVRPGYRHVYHQYTIRVPEQRDEWVMHLRSRGIGTAVHYPLAVHQQSFYREHSGTSARTTADVRLPVTELAAKQVLSLPVHPALSMEDLTTIVQEVRALCA
jgi:dTDP-4-amino-4,6-dideoxygalactose transaminase